PGDSVIEDQVLAEVMTDKATVEVPSAVAGTVLSLGTQAGQMISVGAELISLEVAGGDAEGPLPVAAADWPEEPGKQSAVKLEKTLPEQEEAVAVLGLVSGNPLASP